MGRGSGRRSGPRGARPAGSTPPAFEGRGRADAVLVTLVGELDLASAPVADAMLRDACTDTNLAALDLSALSFMDCAGLSVPVMADARLRGIGGRPVIASSSRQVRRLLHLTRAAAGLDIVELDLGTVDAMKQVVGVRFEQSHRRFVIDLTAQGDRR